MSDNEPERVSLEVAKSVASDVCNAIDAFNSESDSSAVLADRVDKFWAAIFAANSRLLTDNVAGNACGTVTAVEYVIDACYHDGMIRKSQECGTNVGDRLDSSATPASPRIMLLRDELRSFVDGTSYGRHQWCIQHEIDLTWQNRRHYIATRRNRRIAAVTDPPDGPFVVLTEVEHRQKAEYHRKAKRAKANEIANAIQPFGHKRQQIQPCSSAKRKESPVQPYVLQPQHWDNRPVLFRDANKGDCKISFCTWIKNRLWQFKQVFETNLKRIGPDHEWVIVDCGSDDGFNEWVTPRIAGHLNVKLFHHPVDAVHLARLKNVAHRLATGDVLVNLDADNFIGPGFVDYVLANREPKKVFHIWFQNATTGTCGRTAFNRDEFFAVGGYNNELTPGPWDELDLINRARAFGCHIIDESDANIVGGDIVNDKSETMNHIQDHRTYRELNDINESISQGNVSKGRLIANTSTTPSLAHFCFGMKPDFGGKPFSLVHEKCIQSIMRYFDRAMMHCMYEPTCESWQRIKISLGNRLVVRHVKRPLLDSDHVAHLADVVRLQALYEYGGAYFDCDVFVDRDPSELLTDQFTIAKENQWALCNAVMFSPPGQPFVKACADAFATDFRRGEWIQTSCLYPMELSKRLPIRILPRETFFKHTYQDLQKLFASESIPEDSFGVHLWETCSWDGYLSKGILPKFMQSEAGDSSSEAT